MEQAFTIPFPQSVPYAASNDNPNLIEHQELLQAAMERLAVGKLSWEDFLAGSRVAAHPALKLLSAKSGHSLLHIAVLSDRIDLVRELLDCEPYIKLRRNHFGMTASEMAQFLPRAEISALLSPPEQILFSMQANVQIRELDQFNAIHDLKYLARPLFATAQALEEILHRSTKAKMEDAIPPERIWMGIYFDAEIRKGLNPKVSIRFIDHEVGFGVFAEQRIPPCAFVGEYTGVLSEQSKKEIKDKIHSVRYTVWEMGRRKFYIDAEKQGNFTRFINHSAKPNLGLQSVYWRGMPRMIFVALKEVTEGTQLTFDYGTIFWKECKQTPVLFE